MCDMRLPVCIGLGGARRSPRARPTYAFPGLGSKFRGFLGVQVFMCCRLRSGFCLGVELLTWESVPSGS